MSVDGSEVMGSAMNRPENHYAFLYMVHGTQKLFGFPAPFPGRRRHRERAGPNLLFA